MTCMSTEHAAKSTNSRLDELTAAVQANTNACADLKTEIQSLKNLHSYSKLSPEVVITGIPTTASLPHHEIIYRVLDRLKLAGFKSDLIDVRKFELKPGNVQPTRNTISYNTFSLIAKFKSIDICYHIMDVKRKHGKLTIADIFGDTNLAALQGTLFVNELLPSSVYKLFKKTKEIATNKGYKHIWTRCGSIFVRKLDKSDVIPIVTEQDLTNLA